MNKESSMRFVRKNQFRKFTKVFLGVALAATLGACGSGSNDQGTSFTFLGFFSEFPSDACGDIPGGLAGLSISIGTIEGEGSGSEAFGGSTSSVAILGVQNALQGQTVRTDQLFLSYYIPGSSVQPPSTSLPLSLLLGPLPDEAEGTGSSLPPAFEGICNRAFSQTILVPSSIMTWLNTHRGSLPELPVNMVVTARATGVTSAGDRLDTQDTDIFVTITPDNTITPTGAGAGNGGEEVA